MDVADFPSAQKLFDSPLRAPWTQLLDELLGRACPVLTDLPFRGDRLRYYWSAEETEWASDIVFRSPVDLVDLDPALLRHAVFQGAGRGRLSGAAEPDSRAPSWLPRTRWRTRGRGMMPLTGTDARLATILLRGEFAITGFRNRALRGLPLEICAQQSTLQGLLYRGIEVPAEEESLNNLARESVSSDSHAKSRRRKGTQVESNNLLRPSYTP